MPRLIPNQRAEIQATITAAESIVRAWHTGALPPPELPKHIAKSKIRWTPSYRSDKGPVDFRSVAYTAKSISSELGNTLKSKVKSKETINAHPSVILALLLLELFEKGIVDPNNMEKHFPGPAIIKKLLPQAAKLNKPRQRKAVGLGRLTKF